MTKTDRQIATTPLYEPRPVPIPTRTFEFRPDELLVRVRNEYLEMPGLRLTLEQAQRMWQLGRSECELLLRTLVDTGFLARTAAGAFVRAGSGTAGA